jgi:XTP/dITP diphosphohydrolase
MPPKTLNHLVIATHNPGKLLEFQEYFTPYPVSLYDAGAFGLPEPEETGKTFIDNALLKARAAATRCPHPVLSDDSGLCVRALQGAPGIFSARWGGEKRDFSEAMTRVWETLSSQKATDFRASFVCALAIVFPDGTESVFEGSVSGRISWPPKGDKGFGYDPIFIPNNHLQTFGEMDPSKKHFISHRADAMRKLIAAYCTV